MAATCDLFSFFRLLAMTTISNTHMTFCFMMGYKYKFRTNLARTIVFVFYKLQVCEQLCNFFIPQQNISTNVPYLPYDTS